MDLHVQIDATQLTNLLESAGRRAPKLLGSALYGIAEDIMKESRKLVPVKDGILRDSGTVLSPIINEDAVQVEFGYGGEAQSYALEQHENLQYNHRVGGPKYLERPVLSYTEKLGEEIASVIRDRLFSNE